MKLRDSIDFVQIIKEIKNANSPKAKQRGYSSLTIPEL